MAGKTVVGRFAPTPSGEMHLGNAFAALFAWAAARSAGGRMILRIEDLDPLRTGDEYTRGILADMAWLGLDWDEGPDTGGPHAPYRQSERGDFYEHCLAQLQRRGLLYGCFCSRAELHAAVAPHAGDGSYVYNGRCRALSPQQAAEQARTRPPAVRVRVPEETRCIEDAACGRYCENLARDAGDFILRRSDGVFAYQLAAAADDGAMGITQVVRGADLLPSAPRQAWLMETLGYTPPAYGHLPLLTDPAGRRLAKRDGDLSMAALRARLPGPQRLIGALAQAAGLQPTAQPLTARELAGLFCWQKLTHGNIVISENFINNLL